MESITERFAEAQKHAKAMSHVMPRRSFQQQTARSRSSSAPGSSQRRDIPRPRRGGLLLLLDGKQMSGGKCGVPVGSAKVSGEARDATLARPRLLNRLPDDRKRGGERESSPAPKRQKFSCSNVCVFGVHSIKMHTFSQK